MNSTIKIIALLAVCFSLCNSVNAQCKAKPVIKEHKPKVKPYDFNSYADNMLTFGKEPKQIETPFTAYSGDSYKLIFASEAVPQEVVVGIYDRNKKAKSRKELYKQTLKVGDKVLEPFEIKKPGNYYIQFDVPANADSGTVKKMCLYTLIGYKENE